ncbi:peptidyl-prolyl cis-trans isomerase A (cyclophilin A) [Novosphingobium hassiacum]|uniref:peptidylprolyl isomerase n=1 Tax=Novosphingobium hassiacum TaxID=173676 RepID=A0A7W6EUJ5_9SPHN|nr:peptidylprolyl isomerase [Novosphingobium hassiacum]MBB3859262.1 peptidyl-prolyl cis-trans isomerase A (cyclophilin A) [Novosphingobium hassiacum]
MLTRRLAILAPLAIALVAAAPLKKRTAPPPAYPSPSKAALPATVRVVLTTEMGPIVVEVDVARAPVSATNFVRYAETKRFDGVVFYRAMHLAWGEQPNGLIQAGTRGDPRRNLPPIAHEPTNVTGILHKVGTLSLARLAPGTAAGDFSIMVSDQPGLDAQPESSDPEAKAGYAAFGQVIEGMDVVKAIYAAPISETEGEGIMRGQMLAKPVKILTARRLPDATLAPTPAP